MSIPTSLIVVVLVLAWLVVLVPMVARRREAVPEAEMVGGTFRVLRRSGAAPRRRPVFHRREAGDADDAEAVAGSDVSVDQELDEELLDDEYDGAEDDGTDDGTDEYGSDEYSSDEYDDNGGIEDSVVPAVTAPVIEQSGGRRSTGSHPYQADRQVSAGSHPYRPAAHQAPDDLQHQPEPARYQEEWSSYEDEAVGASSSPDPVTAPRQHADDLRLRPIPRRAGRGGYDPDAAEVARQFKYRRRRRVAVVLLLATLLFSAVAVVVNPVSWIGAVVFGLLLIGYLGYLRRQVHIEATIRERRSARLRRARQIRPEFDVRFDNGSGGQPFVRGGASGSQVPPTGFRRGREIVDLDDDDPSFEELEYYQPLTYRRASGQ